MDFEEFMTDGTGDRFAYTHGMPQFDELVARLAQQFDVRDTASWYSVSTAQYNDIYDDEVMSVVFQVRPSYLDFMKPAAVGRKYFMGKGWVYDKVYTYIPPGETPLPCPSGAKSMFVGKLVNVFGQPGDADLTRYQCLYFMHPDHAAMETWAGRSLPQGKYSTFYAATFDTHDANRLLRVKTYAYDQQNGFSDWDVTYLQESKVRGYLPNIA